MQNAEQFVHRGLLLLPPLGIGPHGLGLRLQPLPLGVRLVQAVPEAILLGAVGVPLRLRPLRPLRRLRKLLLARPQRLLELLRLPPGLVQLRVGGPPLHAQLIGLALGPSELLLERLIPFHGVIQQLLRLAQLLLVALLGPSSGLVPRLLHLDQQVVPFRLQLLRPGLQGSLVRLPPLGTVSRLLEGGGGFVKQTLQLLLLKLEVVDLLPRLRKYLLQLGLHLIPLDFQRVPLALQLFHLGLECSLFVRMTLGAPGMPLGTSCRIHHGVFQLSLHTLQLPFAIGVLPLDLEELALQILAFGLAVLKLRLGLQELSPQVLIFPLHRVECRLLRRVDPGLADNSHGRCALLPEHAVRARMASAAFDEPGGLEALLRRVERRILRRVDPQRDDSDRGRCCR
mmetsp:Transcript_10801/g.31988  ORF Transcript_10801/g.31988 Transcript_10801/m.31988 type:complete len:398 (+) Transcript_10801:260-1453(+)